MDNVGSSITTATIGKIVRLKVGGWSARALTNNAPPSRAADAPSEGHGCAFVEGVVSHVSKLAVVLQGAVIVDPRRNFEPLTCGLSAVTGGQYLSTRCATVSRAKILEHVSLDLSARVAAQRRRRLSGRSCGRSSNGGSEHASHEPFPPSNRSTAAAGAPATRAQLPIALFQYHLLRTFALSWAIRREVDAATASAPEVAGEVPAGASVPQRGGRREVLLQISDEQQESAFRFPPRSAEETMGPDSSASGVRQVQDGYSGDGSVSDSPVSPPRRHVRTASTGSQLGAASVSERQQVLVTEFAGEAKVREMWDAFHVGFWAATTPDDDSEHSTSAKPPSLDEAIAQNQEAARDAHRRVATGIHGIGHILAEAQQIAVELRREELKYTSRSSRRRLSPFNLRLERIRAYLRRLFVNQSTCGIGLALVGGIQLAQSVVTPLTESVRLTTAYNPWLWHLAVPSALLACFLGIFLSITARWTSPIPDGQQLAIRICAFLTFLAAVPCYVVAGTQLSRGTAVHTGKTMHGFFRDSAQRSTPELCSYMISFGCSGWDVVCDAKIAAAEERAIAASDGNLTRTDFPYLQSYVAHCPQRCNDAIDSDINIRTMFSPSRACGPMLDSELTTTATQFVVLTSLALATLVCFFVVQRVCRVLFRRAITRDAEVAAHEERQQQLQQQQQT